MGGGWEKVLCVDVSKTDSERWGCKTNSVELCLEGGQRGWRKSWHTSAWASREGNLRPLLIHISSLSAGSAARLGPHARTSTHRGAGLLLSLCLFLSLPFTTTASPVTCDANRPDLILVNSTRSRRQKARAVRQLSSPVSILFPPHLNHPSSSEPYRFFKRPLNYSKTLGKTTPLT